MTFSIVIPCYNIELWIENCLQSIIEQSYKDWEMLIVNDGSTDNTLNILNNYAESDSRIIVINQENRGVSTARNNAISKASGDYLIFLDGDDWYKNEYCLEKIAQSLDNGNNDIVVFRYQAIQSKNNIYNKDCFQYFKKMKGYTYSGEEYLEYVLSEDDVYPWFPVLYAFRRELWIKNKFQFDINLWVLEDMDILYQVILKAQRIKVLDSIIYQYRIREESAIHVKSKKSIYAQLSVCKKDINTVNDMVINQNLKSLLKSNFSYTYFRMLIEVNYLTKNDRKEVLEFLEKNRSLMKYTIRKNNIFIRKIERILGLHITTRLLFLYQYFIFFINYIKR